MLYISLSIFLYSANSCTYWWIQAYFYLSGNLLLNVVSFRFPCVCVFKVQIKTKNNLIYFMQQWTFTHTYFPEGLSLGWFHFLLINFSLESRVVFLYAASHPHCVSFSNILTCLCRWLLKFHWVEKRVKLSYSTERFFNAWAEKTKISHLRVLWGTNAL